LPRHRALFLTFCFCRLLQDSSRGLAQGSGVRMRPRSLLPPHQVCCGGCFLYCVRSETQCLSQTRVAGPLLAHVPATTRVAGSFSGPANDQDQRSWLLHQATKTVGFDHLLVHDSHFLALHTAYIVTLCRMSRYSSTSYCHACLISSCITHITGLCHV